MAFSSDEIEQILRKLGHDLRGPLINVRMAAEVMAALDEPAEREKLGREIDQELARLDRLIDHTLQFARASHCQLVDMPLRPIVAQCLQSLELPPSLQLEHSLHGDPRARVDSDKLVRLLGLLLAQSVDVLHGVASPRLKVALSSQGGFGEITIERNGPPPPEGGTPKPDLSEAFCRRVLEAHQGELRREISTLGGQCLIIRVPETC